MTRTNVMSQLLPESDFAVPTQTSIPKPEVTVEPGHDLTVPEHQPPHT